MNASVGIIGFYKSHKSHKSHKYQNIFSGKYIELFLGEEFKGKVCEFISMLRDNISKNNLGYDYLPSPTDSDLCMESLFISQRNISLDFSIQNQIDLNNISSLEIQKELNSKGFRIDKEFMTIHEIIDRLLQDPFDIKFSRLFVCFFDRILTRQDVINILLEKFKSQKGGLNKIQLGYTKNI